MKKFAISIAAVFACIQASAQNVTYNHDSSKKAQITVMEIGSGSLSPELYYTLLHNGYKKTAAEKNKLSFRTSAGLESYSQVDYAESIDSALTKRAEVEALNVADRQIDLAWKVEGSKIENVLDKFKQNIERIVQVGGTPTERSRWSEYYNAYKCAVTSTKEAYVPNAQRKNEYLKIYEDISKQNETLVKYLVQLHSRSQTDALLTATSNPSINKSSIILGAKERWNTARQKSQPTTKREDNYTSSDGDSAEETVNR